MAGPRILIIEDEPDIGEILQYALEREGYDVALAADGLAGLNMIRKRPPDLLLLDLMLPGIDGLEVARRLKSEPATRSIPIVMVTAKGDEADIVLGLGLGADDYIPKPFSPKEVAARVRAVLRRADSSNVEDTQRVVTRGDLTIDPVRHKVFLGKDEVLLTATEFRILQHLAGRPGRVFDRDQILAVAVGPNTVVTDRSVDVHIRSIRKKLGAQRDLVETVRGIGYRFAE